MRHGKGAWPGLDATFLLAEIALPVCPRLSTTLRPDEDPLAALARIRLIVNAASRTSGRNGPARAPGATSAHGRDRAGRDRAGPPGRRGRARARARPPAMVDNRLSRGTLVAPFGTGDPTGAAYYLAGGRRGAERRGATARAVAAAAGRRDARNDPCPPESNSLAPRAHRAYLQRRCQPVAACRPRQRRRQARDPGCPRYRSAATPARTSADVRAALTFITPSDAKPCSTARR